MPNRTLLKIIGINTVRCLTVLKIRKAIQNGQSLSLQPFCFYKRFELGIFAIPKLLRMTTEQTFPVWYGGGSRKDRNAVISVGHLTRTGFIIPKLLQ